VPKTPFVLESRLRAVEILALWEGRVSNARLRELFGVQIVQASRILNHYRRRFPDALHAASATHYRAASALKPVLSQGHISEYSQLLESGAGGHSAALVEFLPTDFVVVDRRIFATLREAAESGCGVSAHYHSFSRPQGIDRTLFPHTLVRAGRRWHVRAWCAGKKEFSDFVLGRFTRASLVNEPAPVAPTADKAWQKMVPVRLVAHHELPEPQQRILRTEYFAGAQARRISTRAALVPYLIQDLRAAIDPQREHPPDFQIEVANLAEIRPWLFPGADTSQ